MCGICGFTGSSGSAEERAVLKAMCDAMAHRGPDGEGLYLADGVALGHRRLALIDLAGGGQPLVRESSARVCAVSTTARALPHARGDGAAVASVASDRVGNVGAAGAGAADGDDAGAFATCSSGAGDADGADADPGNGGGTGMTRGRWSIVFNGEIYNYRELRAELQELGFAFATGSDTEVLLVGYIAWGAAVLDRLRGMFAFAIYDACARELFCARDFFGIKPFYYAVCNGQFVFASEIKAILEHPAYERALNEEALAAYLCFQFSALPETFFKGIFKLAPGHCARVGADGVVAVKRYWQPRFDYNESRSWADAVDAVDASVRESVRYHNVADVEVGSFLSSGIDSSYLAACLTRENPDIKTFTVGFAQYCGERDEVSWARELAGRLGVENDSKHISEEEYWDVLPRVQWHMDEPSADPSAVALYFVDAIAARRVKAVLSGEGADEFFAGYRVYQAPLAGKRVGGIPRPLLQAASKVLKAAHRRGANYLERASEDVSEWYYTNANGVAFSAEERERVLSAEVLKRLAGVQSVAAGVRGNMGCDDADAEGAAIGRAGAERVAAGAAPGGVGQAVIGLASPQQLTAPVYAQVEEFDEVTRMQYVDLHFWLVGDILLKTDKMAMAHSLESRVPFLDREVFALAASIPVSQKITERQTKVVLRDAAARAIPSDWAQKEKLGFPVPVVAWLREERYYGLVKEAFTSPEAARFFNVAELVRLLDEHRAGADNSRRIWIVYSFIVWYRVFFVDRAKPE